MLIYRDGEIHTYISCSKHESRKGWQMWLRKKNVTSSDQSRVLYCRPHNCPQPYIYIIIYLYIYIYISKGCAYIQMWPATLHAICLAWLSTPRRSAHCTGQMGSRDDLTNMCTFSPVNVQILYGHSHLVQLRLGLLSS